MDEYGFNFGGLSGMPMPSPMPQHAGLFKQAQSFMMNNPLMSTVLGGAGSLIGSGLNFLGQRMQNTWNERMWNQMNEYNTPEAQIQRFLDAGVNPAAAVASVTGTPNMTSMAGSQSGPTAQGDLGALGANAGLNMSSQMLSQEQAQTQDVQREVLKSEAKKNEAQAGLFESQDVGQMIDNSNKQDIIDKTLRDMDDRHEINSSQARMMFNDAALSDILFSGKITQFYMGLAMTVQELANLEVEHEEIKSRIALNYKDIDLKESEIGLNEANRLRSLRDAELIAEDARYKRFRNNCIQKFHYDPESSTESNIAFMLQMGDGVAAFNLANGLGRLDAQTKGWVLDREFNVNNQMSVKDVFNTMSDMLKYFVAGNAFGSASQYKGSSTTITNEYKYNHGTRQYEPVGKTEVRNISGSTTTK